MKNISSIAWRGQSPSRSLSTVNKQTWHPISLQVRRNSWPFSYELTQRIVSGCSSGKQNLREAGEAAKYNPPLYAGIQKPQESTDPLGPGRLIMFGAFDSLVVEIALILPAALQKNVAVSFHI